MQHNKNEAINLYIDMIQKSWTYQRLTEEEKTRLMDTINWGEQQGIIKGTFKQRWDILQLMYHSYLNALDYKPIGWREDDEIPLF